MVRVPTSKRTIAAAAFVLVAGCLVLLVLMAAVVGRAPPDWVPGRLQLLAFDVRLAAAPAAKKAVTLTRMPLRNARVYVDRLGRYEDAAALGSAVPGTLYRPSEDLAGSDPRPGVVLLHGSTPEGRKMGLYRLLGRMLAERGYVVMSIDHGSTGDALAAIRLLASLDDVAHDDIALIGHSGGAAVALSAGIPAAAVARIVAMGPGVRIEERSREEEAYFQRRRARYGQAPAVPEPDTFPPRQWLEFHMDYFSRPDHKPLLLIQGELKDHADLEFLERLHARMAGPATLLRIPADHYMNVVNLGAVVAYDPGAAARLVQGIDAWLGGGEPRGCGADGSSCDLPGASLASVAGILAGLHLLGLALLLLAGKRRRAGPGPAPAGRTPADAGRQLQTMESYRPR